jgi:lipopolysaccharide export system permease protein
MSDGMGSIGWYIFRTTFGAFALILTSLTAVIWVTQALRDIDLITSQGQTILTFLGITSLAIPLLVLVIAPIALVIAVAHVLNKLSTDSELIVMNAAGMSPWRVFRAFLAVGVVVSVMVTLISSWLAPLCMRELRYRASEARADLVANIVQPGRFSSIERGLTFHIRERRSNGQLMGIFVDDWRDPKERATFLAEQGDILRNERGTYLVMANGSVQRYEKSQNDPTIVLFDRYAFDLSQFAGAGPSLQRSVRERFIWDLIWPQTSDPTYQAQRGSFRAELHERLAAPLYPFVFIIVAFAYLGAPRTTRQSRGMALAAIVLAVGVLRVVGFTSTVFSVQNPSSVFVQYIAFAVASGFGLHAISRGTILEVPTVVTDAVTALTERFNRRAATT